MTYQQTIEYLYARLPMFTRIGAAAYKKDLHNTIALLQALGNPQQHFKCIHIAGTNGKGSSSHMLAAIMQQHGYKTGLYTSPHLVDFRERIKINGEWIDATFIIDFTNRIRPIIEAIEPSFFEVTVAMAFEWFAQQQVDIAIIETGLGGRLDSTNVITPLLSIITNIGWDHMALLGDTLEKIAFEKAGIIKPGIPVVIGETLPETKQVFESKAATAGSAIYFAEAMLRIDKIQLSLSEMQLTLSNTATQQQATYTTSLSGIYQQYNLRTVIASTSILQQLGWPLQTQKIADGIAQVQALTGLAGRWQVLRQKPALVLDVAHNVNGIAALLQHLAQLQNHQPDMQVHWIMGMVKDKDLTAVLQKLPPTFKYYFTQAALPRALPVEELKHLAEQQQLQGNTYAHVNDAIAAALAVAAPKDFIMVCGSVFVVGEVAVSRFTLPAN